MKYTFELYILGDQLTKEDWNKFYQSLSSYIGVLGKFELIFTCKDNVIRFFVASEKDIGSLSNNIDGLLLRPVDNKELNLPAVSRKERNVQFVNSGNILDLKEKYAVKKAQDLQIAKFRIRTVNPTKAVVNVELLFKNAGNVWSRGTKLITFFPANLLQIDFAGNTRYLKKTIPKYLNIEKALHMLVGSDINALFQVDTFPYFNNDYFLNITNYEFDKHSFIIGASGSGKSKFISLFVDRLAKTSLKMNYRVVVIDPHASIADDFTHIPETKILAFGKEDSTDLFPGAGADLTSATELTATLFKSILDDQFNARIDRLLRFSLFTLMTAQAMSLENLKRFLTDVEYRNQIVGHVEGYIPQNVVKFFGADFNEIRTQHYNETILPIVSMVDEMQLQPSLVGENETSLAKTIQENFLTVFSLNKVSMGEKVVKTVAGLLIQQIFLLAQANAFGQKVILIIDEVSVVQNPTLSQILAEARKFNLTVILTQQYFGQVEKDLRDAIFANVYNYYAFKVSEEDARALEGNLNIEIPKEIVEAERSKGVNETDMKIKIMTELHPRECLIRVMSNGQIAPSIKARTVDAPKQTANKPARLEEAKQKLPEKFVEGQARAKKEITFSPEFLEHIAAESEETRRPETFGGPELQDRRPFGGLRELLASHSSSRSKVNKKDKS